MLKSAEWSPEKLLQRTVVNSSTVAVFLVPDSATQSAAAFRGWSLQLLGRLCLEAIPALQIWTSGR